MCKKSILFLLILTSAFTFPMRRYASRLFTRQNATKVGSKALTITGHSIAWGLPLYEGYKGVKTIFEEPKPRPDSLLSDQANKFVQKEIKKYEINPELIHVFPSIGFGTGTNKWLFIPSKEKQIKLDDELSKFARKKLRKQKVSDQAWQEHMKLQTYTCSEIGWLLKVKAHHKINIEYVRDQQQGFFSYFLVDSKVAEQRIQFSQDKLQIIKQTLNEYKASIGHELGHFAHKDAERNLFQKLICAGLVEITRLGLKKIVPFICNPLIKNLLQIPSGCARLTGTLHLESRYNQHREFRADDFIRNDIDILQAMANHFYQKNQDEEEYIHTSLKEANLKEKIELIAKYRVFKTHPYSLLRVKRIENRIEKLKREQESS